MKGVLKDRFVVDWENVIELAIKNEGWDKVTLFVVRYALQLTIHTIWMERNRRRHGEEPRPVGFLRRIIDKFMRNKITILQRKGSKGFDKAMEFWFETR